MLQLIALLYLLSVLSQCSIFPSSILHSQCITSVYFISQDHCMYSIYYSLNRVHLTSTAIYTPGITSVYFILQHYSVYYLSIVHLMVLLYLLSVTASPHSAPIPAQCITSVYIILLAVLYVLLIYLVILLLTALLYKLSVFPRHTSSHQPYSTYSVDYLKYSSSHNTTVHT